MAFDLDMGTSQDPMCPPDGTGMPLVRLARERYPQLPMSIYTGYDDPGFRREAAALDADYLIKARDDAALYQLQRRCDATAPALPPLPDAVASDAQARDALVHWTAHLIRELDIGFHHGRALFVQAEALALRGRLLRPQEEADALGISKRAVTKRREKIRERARVFSIEELFRRICANAGLYHRFGDRLERSPRTSGVVPRAAHSIDPLAPTPAHGADEQEG